LIIFVTNRSARMYSRTETDAIVEEL